MELSPLSVYYQKYRHYKQRYKTLQKEYHAIGGANSDKTATTYTKHVAIPMFSRQGILLENSFTERLIDQAWKCYQDKTEIQNKTYNLEFKDPYQTDSKPLTIMDLLDKQAQKKYQSSNDPELKFKLKVLEYILYENFRQPNKRQQKQQQGGMDYLPSLATGVILVASSMLYLTQEPTRLMRPIPSEQVDDRRSIFMILIPDTEYRYTIKITCHKDYRLSYQHEQKIYHHFQNENGELAGKRCVLRYHSEIDEPINQNHLFLNVSFRTQDGFEIQDVTLDLRNHINQIRKAEEEVGTPVEIVYTQEDNIMCYGFVTDFLSPTKGFNSLNKVIESNLGDSDLIKNKFSETVQISRHLWDKHRLFHGDLHAGNVMCNISDQVPKVNDQRYHSIVFFDFDFSSLVGHGDFTIAKNFLFYPFSRENETKIIKMEKGHFEGEEVAPDAEGKYPISSGVESFCISFDFIRLFNYILAELYDKGLDYFIRDLHLILDEDIITPEKFNEYLHILQNWVMYLFKHIDGNHLLEREADQNPDGDIYILVRKVNSGNPLTSEDIKRLKGCIYSKTVDDKLKPKPYITLSGEYIDRIRETRYISYNMLYVFIKSQFSDQQSVKPLIPDDQQKHEVFYGGDKVGAFKELRDDLNWRDIPDQQQ